MVGMIEIKDYLTSIVQLLRLEMLRRGQIPGLAKKSLLENFGSTGNRGTGKTTVARKIGLMYKSMGLLQRGHTIEVSAADLIAGYMG